MKKEKQEVIEYLESALANGTTIPVMAQNLAEIFERQFNEAVEPKNDEPSQLGGSKGFVPPGAGVERHLRTYGHLPELGCCPHDQPESEDFCHCGHGRTMHAKIPFSPNYTEGRCGWKVCQCQHFNIK
jgi:hypothetical protein